MSTSNIPRPSAPKSTPPPVRPVPPASIPASIVDGVNALVGEAKLLEFAVYGLMEFVKHSRPHLALPDELEPFADAAQRVARRAGELYKLVDPDVAARTHNDDRDYRWMMAAALRERQQEG